MLKYAVVNEPDIQRRFHFLFAWMEGKRRREITKQDSVVVIKTALYIAESQLGWKN